MPNIICIDKDAIDKEYDEKHGGSKFWKLSFTIGSYLVYREYPSFSEQDALDLFADWAVDNTPGYIPNDDYISELQADARKDGREDEDDYVNDYYIRAGNDGHWVEMPVVIEEIS